MGDLIDVVVAIVTFAIGWFGRGAAHRWQVRRMMRHDTHVSNVDYWVRQRREREGRRHREERVES